MTADQISKHLVRLHLDPGVPWQPVPWLRRILSITYVTNKGAAFGLFSHLDWLFTLIAIAVIALILFFHRHVPSNRWLLQASLGMQLGGALGNLVDRLLRNGFVTDFIDLNFWPLQEWPVFNVADSSIVVGTCILAGLVLLEEELLPPTSDTQVSDDERAA